MIDTAFKIAMLNRLRLAPYEQPHIRSDASDEWLIVERTGADGTVLFISDAGFTTPPQGDNPPADLAPRNTIVGLLARPELSGEEPHGSRYLLVRHNSTGLAVPGTFFPADGYAELNSESGQLRLLAFGRHAHSSGWDGSTTVHHDIPYPAPAMPGAITWHFEATERPNAVSAQPKETS